MEPRLMEEHSRMNMDPWRREVGEAVGEGKKRVEGFRNDFSFSNVLSKRKFNFTQTQTRF